MKKQFKKREDLQNFSLSQNALKVLKVLKFIDGKGNRTEKNKSEFVSKLIMDKFWGDYGTEKEIIRNYLIMDLNETTKARNRLDTNIQGLMKDISQLKTREELEKEVVFIQRRKT